MEQKPLLNLDTPVRYIKGIGPKKEEVFNNIGVRSVKDLLYYFPFRYEDRRDIKTIKELKEGEFCLLRAKVSARKLKKMPYFLRKKVRDIFTVILEDSTGRIDCVWFNQGYLYDKINVNDEIIIYGKPTITKEKLQFNSPEYELNPDSDSLNLGRIVSVYRLPNPFTQKFIRKTLDFCLNQFHSSLIDPIPFDIRNERKLLNIAKSLEEMHLPTSWEEAAAARERFIFEELFISQILVYLRKAKHRLQKGIPLKVNQEIIAKIKKNLNFELTNEQNQALSQILCDIEKAYPMHRLLQGDVGCGKTIVAAFGMAQAIFCGYQAAIMAPTEVLAYQHKESLENIFKGLNFTIEVLTSSLSREKIKKIHQNLKEGKINLIVGTHSLIQEEIEFSNLGFVVVDEQHKFGVAQRALLSKKGKPSPHVLVMSATPIPRSLALSLYGDLDLSIIKEFPKGRILPENMWLCEDKRKWVYDFIKSKLNEGRQVYIIYPLIEESVDEDLKSLKVMHNKLTRIFKDYKTAMFHGKLKNDEKLKVIQEFKENKINILVSTTVVEVGVNIENATVMVVENPERFGLAQLHQLRGRIRRASFQPYFIMLSDAGLSETASRRLEVISKTNDGFVIAEEDLKLRGPGDFFGASQHGLPPLKIANPLRDLEILKEARVFAYKTVKNDPFLEKSANRCIKEEINYWFQG